MKGMVGGVASVVFLGMLSVSKAQQNSITITNRTWVTNSDGELMNYNVKCENCELICNEDHSCDGFDFTCMQGDCNVVCLGSGSCFGGTMEDFTQCGLLNVSCVGYESCTSSRIYWDHPSSVMEFHSNGQSAAFGASIFITGPDQNGNLKPWYLSCSEYFGCAKMSFRVSETNLNLSCTGDASCSEIQMQLVSDSIIQVNCSQSDTACYFNGDGSASISGFERSEAIVFCGEGESGISSSCDWEVYSNAEYKLLDSNLTFINAPIYLDCQSEYSCVNSDFLVMYDPSNWRILCGGPNYCVNVQTEFVTHSPSISPTMNPTRSPITSNPTFHPTYSPSVLPTSAPIQIPSQMPTDHRAAKDSGGNGSSSNHLSTTEWLIITVAVGVVCLFLGAFIYSRMCQSSEGGSMTDKSTLLDKNGQRVNQ